jgi:hypothetical protein
MRPNTTAGTPLRRQQRLQKMIVSFQTKEASRVRPHSMADEFLPERVGSMFCQARGNLISVHFLFLILFLLHQLTIFE